MREYVRVCLLTFIHVPFCTICFLLQVSDCAAIQLVPKSKLVSPIYKLLDAAMKNLSVGESLMFDERAHVAEPFQSPMQRLRFSKGIQLSVDVEILTYVHIKF